MVWQKEVLTCSIGVFIVTQSKGLVSICSCLRVKIAASKLTKGHQGPYFFRKKLSKSNPHTLKKGIRTMQVFNSEMLSDGWSIHSNLIQRNTNHPPPQILATICTLGTRAHINSSALSILALFQGCNKIPLSFEY